MSHDVDATVALDELFPAARRTACRPPVISSCTSNWQHVQPGDAYVAVLEDDLDGHDFVTQAVQRGAAAIIVERPVPVFTTPVYEVEDTRVAFGELCQALAEHPSRRLRVIGVIGTQGKSSVIALLESILRTADCEVGVISTLKTSDGMTCGAGIGQDYSPTWLADRLARMEAAGCSHVLLEISSEILARHRLAGVELDVVCSTVVDADRLDLHNTPQNYRDHLRRAFDLLAAEGMAVLNGDDAVSCRWLSTLDAPSITYGFGEQAQITADIVERNACETVFVLTAGCDSAAVRTVITGDHHVANCLAAAAAAIASGIPFQDVARGIELVTTLPARMQRIDCGQDFAVFVDAARTPCGMRAALRTARQMARSRVICVLGDSAPSSVEEAAAIFSIVHKMADMAIVPQSLAEAEPRWSTAGDDDVVCELAADRAEAIAVAVARAEEGDVVVIVGSRGPTEVNFGAGACDDAEATRQILFARDGRMLRLVA